MPRVSLLMTTLVLLTSSPIRAATPPGTAQQLLGKGVQIYRCKASPSGPSWVFSAPDATLQDASGRVVGHHAAGPSWTASDASTVVGTVLAASQAPAAHAVPWLLLRAASATGNGRFSRVTYIVRAQTEGGAAPSTGCDAAHLNAGSARPTQPNISS